jgi:hypothetical protein
MIDTVNILGVRPQHQAASDREQAAFENWLERECPSGDVTEVQRQWEASYALQQFLEDEKGAAQGWQAPPLVVTP